MKSFSSVDVSTREQWMTIAEKTIAAQPRVGPPLLSMIKGLGATDGFSIDQREHALQTATRAGRDGANEEVVVASLSPDVGESISVDNHPWISAAILKPTDATTSTAWSRATWASEVVTTMNTSRWIPIRATSTSETWYELARSFAHGWDRKALGPGCHSEPLEHLEPMVLRVFARAKSL